MGDVEALVAKAKKHEEKLRLALLELHYLETTERNVDPRGGYSRKALHEIRSLRHWLSCMKKNARLMDEDRND